MRGHVRKRGSTWTWYLDIDPDPLTARRRQQTKGGYKTKKACEDGLNEAIAKQRVGMLVKPSRRTMATFLVDEWLPTVRRRARLSTWANYRTNVNVHVVPVLGDVELQRLSPDQLNAFYGQLLEHGRRDGKGLAWKTVKNIHAMLHKALKDAMRWGYLTRNVADAVDPPQGLAPEMQVWTPEQLRRFLREVHGDELYAAWMLFATTGMRRGEVAGLRDLDLDLDAAYAAPRRPRVVVDYAVHLSEPKTYAGRRLLALDPATVAALREHLARRDTRRAELRALGVEGQATGLLFTFPDGSEIHPDLLTRWFKRHARRAGLLLIRLHDVRHTYATAWPARRHPGQGRQRAPGARQRGHHPADLRPRPARHGPGRRQHDGDPHPRRHNRGARKRVCGPLRLQARLQPAPRARLRRGGEGLRACSVVVAGGGFEPPTSGL
jgi:integrase